MDIDLVIRSRHAVDAALCNAVFILYERVLPCSASSPLYARYSSMSSAARSRYSFSSKISMHFLMSGTLGTKRLLICEITSLTSWLCFIVLRDFMIRTIAD